MLLRVAIETDSQLLFFYFMTSIPMWTKGTAAFYKLPIPCFDELESPTIL